MPPNDFDEDHPYYEVMRLLSMGKATEAVALLQTVDLKVHPGAYEATYAEVYRAQERVGEAGERAKRALELGWDTPRVRAILGHALWKAGLREEALVQYDHLADSSVSSAVNRGWIAFQADDFPSAEEYAAHALELDPQDDIARPLLLAARAAQGDVVARRELRELWTESGLTAAIEYLIQDGRLRTNWTTSSRASAKGRRRASGWLDS